MHELGCDTEFGRERQIRVLAHGNAGALVLEQGAAQGGNIVGPEDNASLARARMQGVIDEATSSAAGRLPTERDLAASLGVGRRAVRRALEALEAEGLIWRKQGKGTFAGQPPQPTQGLAAALAGETNVIEVMEARQCIEPALAAMCARHAVPSDIERMRNLARRTVRATDPDAIELWDGALHRLIARTARNKPLLTAFSLTDEIRGVAESWIGCKPREAIRAAALKSDFER